MSLTNPMRDFEIADPQAMRALAHPVRLAILVHLQRHGPATATQLSSSVGASPSVTSWHLRHLSSFGLVEDAGAGPDARARWWKAVARGFRLSPPAEPGQPGAEEAYRTLSQQLFRLGLAQAEQWSEEVEPTLSRDWLEQAGAANTRVVVTVDELATIEGEIEKLLAVFVHRAESDVPAGARGVRLLRCHMPEAVDPDGAP
jgi:DNA-binding transcriptional ArsR family regulator